MDEAFAAIARLSEKGQTVASAESCTGGMLGALLTEVAGSSKVYLGGVISYAYAAKRELLGVDAALLEARGAVCEEVAMQMAGAVREKLQAHWGIAITGNAGPGADEKNPIVGEVFIACANAETCRCKKLNLSGNRQENREDACREALKLLL
ncbi:MAG: CinA family protein [Oscillospiraceae bacterium]|jgi:PncC family amidohydrolase|nr:CinA family protein [Oscillospiraceae bacterium]